MVLAGLYPPLDDHKFDNGLNWQPIPYEHEPLVQDRVSLSRIILHQNIRTIVLMHSQRLNSIKQLQIKLDNFQLSSVQRNDMVLYLVTRKIHTLEILITKYTFRFFQAWVVQITRNSTNNISTPKECKMNSNNIRSCSDFYLKKVAGISQTMMMYSTYISALGLK